MAADFPGALPTASVIPSGGTQDVSYNGRTHPESHNDLWAELLALATKLGIGATTPDAVGKILAATAAGTSTWGYNAPYKLAEAVLGSDQASVTFSSIPQTFAHLMLLVYARTSVAANSDQLLMQFNGDTGANYDTQSYAVNNTTFTGSELIAGTAHKPGEVVANTGPANAFGGMTIHIPHYANSANHKAIFTANNVYRTGTTSGTCVVRGTGGFWRSTAAITSVLIGSIGGGNLKAGSIFSLYGLP